MLKKIICLIITLILCSICLLGCDNQAKEKDTNDIKYKVLIDTIEDSNIIAAIYYERAELNGRKSKTYYWENKKIVDTSDKYKLSYANIYPISSLDSLQKKMNLSNSPEYKYGQLYFYGNTEDYEVFVFDGARNGNSEWKIFFNSGGGIKEVLVNKDIDEMRLDSCQITEDTLYIYTRAINENNSDIVIYKIDLENYNVNKIIIPFNEFKIEEVVMKLNQVFIKDDIFLLSTSEYDFNKDTKNKGVFLRYNLKTQKADTFFIDDIIHKAIPYDDKYLVLCSDKDTYQTSIKYFDKDLKLVKSDKININTKLGKVIISPRDRFFNLHNGRLYGSMSLDGSFIEYLVVIDIATSEIVYLSEFENINLSATGYAKQEVRYCINDNGRFIYLSPF